MKQDENDQNHKKESTLVVDNKPNGKSQIITPAPRCISPDDSLVEAAAEMKALDTGWLPICEHDCLIGTVTDRDITIRAVAEGYDPNITPVRQVMSRVVIHCFDDQDIWNAAQMMVTNKI